MWVGVGQIPFQQVGLGTEMRARVHTRVRGCGHLLGGRGSEKEVQDGEGEPHTLHRGREGGGSGEG